MFCKKEYIADQLKEGENYIKGKHDPKLYDFDGTTVTKKPNQTPRKKALIEQDAKKVLSKMINDQALQGYQLPSFNERLSTPNQAYARVNLAVSEACERHVSPGKYTNFIYLFKEADAKKWIADGEVEADAPELVKSWFDNSDFTTLSAAAENIIQQAAFMRDKIEKVERIRLEARKAILAATSDYSTVIAPFITRLENV